MKEVGVEDIKIKKTWYQKQAGWQTGLGYITITIEIEVNSPHSVSNR